MSVTDPIANFFTVIRNASLAKHENVTSRASNTIVRIAEILKEEKFIRNYHLIEEDGKRSLRISLRYLKEGRPAIKSLMRVSKPGLRHYVDADSIPQVLKGFGIAILSTSKGVMTDRAAKKARVGGELLCKVY